MMMKELIDDAKKCGQEIRILREVTSIRFYYLGEEKWLKVNTTLSEKTVISEEELFSEIEGKTVAQRGYDIYLYD